MRRKKFRNWGLVTDIVKWKSQFAVLRGFYFREKNEFTVTVLSLNTLKKDPLSEVRAVPQKAALKLVS